MHIELVAADTEKFEALVGKHRIEVVSSELFGPGEVYVLSASKRALTKLAREYYSKELAKSIVDEINRLHRC